MLILLSPAKIQNFNLQTVTSNYSLPKFMNEAAHLIHLMRDLSPAQISKLLAINTKLTDLNYDRYFNWHQPFTTKNAKQAALVFDGEVFRGLNAQTFSELDFDYAQQHLMILSGLYGALRPLDLIQPYRLEISSALANERGKNLYAFWQNTLTNHLLKELDKKKSDTVINLASSEYFKAFNLKKTNVKVIDVEFLEYKNDSLKPIVIYTKKARGMMARFLITNRIETTEEIKGFAEGGYWFNPQLSNENKLVFVR